MKVELFLTQSEAAAIASALDFVRCSMSLDADGRMWIYRHGGQFTCEVEDVLQMEYVADSIRDAVAEEANRVQFAGYCRTF